MYDTSGMADDSVDDLRGLHAADDRGVLEREHPGQVQGHQETVEDAAWQGVKAQRTLE